MRKTSAILSGFAITCLVIVDWEQEFGRRDYRGAGKTGKE